MRKLIMLITPLLLLSLIVGAVGCGEEEKTPTPPVTPILTPTRPALDSDGDGWTDAQEQAAGTDLYSVDTDGDGYWDPEDSNPLEISLHGCTDCHTTEAAAWENFSSHKGIYKTCTFCHEEADPVPGEGHQASPSCDQCHSEVSHSPEQYTGSEGNDNCMTCHNPMGSRNLYLIRERILVEQGQHALVDFRSWEGRADYSYAELGTEDGGQNDREPGSGLCEVCHTKTAFYNRAGTGEDHDTVRCVDCHNHAIGFEVEAAD